MLGAALMAALANEPPGEQALKQLCSAGQGPSLGMRFGSNPKRANGGLAKQCAANFQRAARRRRNIAKHPRCRG